MRSRWHRGPSDDHVINATLSFSSYSASMCSCNSEPKLSVSCLSYFPFRSSPHRGSTVEPHGGRPRRRARHALPFTPPRHGSDVGELRHAAVLERLAPLCDTSSPESPWCEGGEKQKRDTSALVTEQVLAFCFDSPGTKVKGAGLNAKSATRKGTRTLPVRHTPPHIPRTNPSP